MSRITAVVSLFLFLVVNCFSQSIPVPADYSLIDTASGDLDNDGVDELVVAYNTSSNADVIDDGIPRELVVYKQKHAEWTVWQRSASALMGSRDGGMMGDPFGDLSIEKGVLTVSHDGGSSWKWSHIDKYRFNGKAFILIGYVSHYGKLCEYWEQVDFNLATGKLIYHKEFESCDSGVQVVYKRQSETFFRKGIIITLQDRSEEEVKIISPKYGYAIYIPTRSK